MFDFVGVHHAHEQIGRQGTQIVLTARLKHHFAAGVRHDRVVYLCSVRAGVENLAGELIGENEMKSKTARLIQILGNRRRDEILELINIGVKRFHLFGVRAFAALLGGRPKVTQEQGREQRSVFLGDASALGGKIHDDNRAVFKRFAQIEGSAILAKHQAQAFVV